MDKIRFESGADISLDALRGAKANVAARAGPIALEPDTWNQLSGISGPTIPLSTLLTTSLSASTPQQLLHNRGFVQVVTPEQAHERVQDIINGTGALFQAGNSVPIMVDSHSFAPRR